MRYFILLPFLALFTVTACDQMGMTPNGRTGDQVDDAGADDDLQDDDVESGVSPQS